MKGLADIAVQDGYITHKIKDKTYTIGLLPAFPAAEVGAKLLELFLPAIGTGADSFKAEPFVLPEDSTLFSSLSLELSKSMGLMDVQELLGALLYDVSEGSTKIDDVSNHFKGKLASLVILVEAALKGNFGGAFLDYCEAKGLEIPSMAEIVETMKPQDTTPEESQSS